MRYLLACLFLLFAACSNSEKFDASATKFDENAESMSSKEDVNENIELCLNTGDLQPLEITEILTHNLDWVDEYGETPSWIEIHNPNSCSVSLKNFYLSNDSTLEQKWRFGDIVIKANSYKVFFCDKKNTTNHTSWKLKENGGTIFLLDSLLNVVDSASYPNLPSGISFGKNRKKVWGFIAAPSPEAVNRNSTWYKNLSEKVPVETEAGFYSEPITIQPPVVNSSGTVRCTQDGSIPDSLSPIFDAPITIRQNTILRCGLFKTKMLTKSITTNSYFIGENTKMSIVSISIDPKFFEETYYYNNHSCDNPDPDAGYLKDTEYPVHVEYFENGIESKERAFEIDAGLTISGNCTRYLPKKSVDIKMREEYQDGRLQYALFDVRPEKNIFKAFRLRNLGNRYSQDFFGDAAFTSQLEGTGVDYQRHHPVLVFYNGEFYGIHYIREKLNRYYIETNYGIKAEDVTVVKHIDNSFEGDSTGEYESLIRWIAKSDLSDSLSYKSILQRMDLNNFANYMAFEIYSLNDDWPTNNVRVWKAKNTPWKFMAYDMDCGYDKDLPLWEDSDKNIFNWIRDKSTKRSFAQVYTKLIQNKDFKRKFINHSAIMFNSFLTEKKISTIIQKLRKTIESKQMDRDKQKFPRKSSKDGDAIIQWAKARDVSVREDYRKEFDLGKDIAITLFAKGRGKITVDEMELPVDSQSDGYECTFFEGNDLLLEAVPQGGSVFAGWSDGNRENPRLVSPKGNMTFTAIFK